MRRKFVAQTQWLSGGGVLYLLAQGCNLADQLVDLLLLAKDREVELINHVFGIADLHFKIVQARFHDGFLFFLITPVAQRFFCFWQRPVIGAWLAEQGASGTEQKYNND